VQRADAPQVTLVWLLGMRWPTKPAIRGSKDELRMDHFEVRSWRGWNHYLTMTILSHHFLVWQHRSVGVKAPALTLPQVRVLLSMTLPQRVLTRTTVLHLVARIQYRNYAAACSHRRHTLRLDLS
jgi:hypothetical protein